LKDENTEISVDFHISIRISAQLHFKIHDLEWGYTIWVQNNKWIFIYNTNW